MNDDNTDSLSIIDPEKDSFALPVPHDSTVALLRSLGGAEGTR